MRHDNPSCALIALIAVLLLLALCQSSVGGSDWYATFEHNGTSYAVSEQYQEGTWQEGLDYCAAMGDGWRLPTLDEGLAMRDRYDGNDPFDIDGQPGWCMPGFRALWTVTDCQHGAWFVHPRSTYIVDDKVPYLDCDYDIRACCFAKSGYSVYHVCPMARCVRPLDDKPEPTVTPTRTATPTNTPTATSTVEPTSTATSEPTETPSIPPTNRPEPTETPSPFRLWLPLVIRDGSRLGGWCRPAGVCW